MKSAPATPIPLLIDTDMGVDDAVAIALALAAPALDVRSIVATGGNVDRDQSLRNVRRLLEALRPARLPSVGCGLDQQAPGLLDARHVFGRDGLGEVGDGQATDAPPGRESSEAEYLDVYRAFLRDGGPEAVVVAIGPLTTLAAVLRQDAPLLRRARRIVVMGGALWCPGNVQGLAEFNVYRDPAAAAAVFGAGLPITLVPLDVTRSVTLDESHRAHLAACGTPAGEFLAAALAYPMRHSTEAGPGRFIVHDALAVGVLLWPELFVKTGLRVEVDPGSAPPGRTRPILAHHPAGRLDALTAVNAIDFMENLLERLCDETFVV